MAKRDQKQKKARVGDKTYNVTARTDGGSSAGTTDLTGLDLHLTRGLALHNRK
jgi:hypothetical protein